MSLLEGDKLRVLLRNAIPKAFAELQQKLSGERIYGFSLCLEALGSFVGAYGNSEEGLNRIVAEYLTKQRYASKRGNLAEHLRHVLRWNCEDGWLALDDAFTEASALLRSSFDADPDAFLEFGCDRLVYLECLGALAESDCMGIFGRDGERESVTLNLYLGDQSDEMLLGWANQVNSHGVYKRFESELAAAVKADELLVYSPQSKE